MLKKSDKIISSVRKQQTRYFKKSHKFDFELPKTLEHTLVLDAKNANSIWTDGIFKELKNVKVAFTILPDEMEAPIGHQVVQFHMVWA